MENNLEKSSEKVQQTAKSIRKLVIGVIVTEYALMELREDAKQDLKYRANIAIKAAKAVQDYFKFHPQCLPEHKKVFEKEFIKSELYMISELLECVWGIDDEGLEIIINAIKENISNEK